MSLVFVVVTTFVCGALVMALEVLGARVIGPFFGVSLFVWTSLIGVTLLALALGYAAGGVFADRWRSPDGLYAAVVLAGVFVLLTPILKSPVLKLFAPLGIRAGSFAGALVLFGPPLFLLGFVTPWVIRIAATETKRLGRTVGLLSAASTAGSLAGTLLTGYVLVSRFGVTRILQGAGTLLLLLGAAYFVLFRKRRAVAAVLLLPLLVARPDPAVVRTLPDGTTASVVLRRDTFYGTLRVVDYVFGERHNRELLVDGAVQGGVDVSSGQSVYEYPYALSFLPWALRPGGRSCLVLGLGAGVVPAWFEARGARTDVVEIDPAIVEVAREQFGLRLAGEVTVADARTHLEGLARTYDYVIVDVFSSDELPAHLVTREALERIRSRVAPGGVVAANLIVSLSGDTFTAASIARTFGSVFENVELTPLFDPAGDPGWGNVILLAYDGPSREADAAELRRFPIHPLAREGVEPYLTKRFRFAPGVPSVVLTDELNPVTVRDSGLRERLRRAVLAANDWDILL